MVAVERRDAQRAELARLRTPPGARTVPAVGTPSTPCEYSEYPGAKLACLVALLEVERDDVLIYIYT
jgi:hypothetical protein